MATNPLPENAATLQPAEARALFRRNGFHGCSSGFCLGYAQANLVVMPESLADDFERFCRVNSGPFPLLYRSGVGECSAPPLANDSDVKTDLPRYIVFKKGKRMEDTLDLSGFEQSWGNLVSFYLGCSFTFESALIANGIRLRNMERGLNISMFLANIQLNPVGTLGGRMLTSMRPIKRAQLSEAFRLSAEYPDFHGAPIHIGNPARIGVRDIAVPSAGDPCEVEEDEVPVFWACGFSVSQILSSVAPPLAFTHFGGSMFITDMRPQPQPLADNIEIVELSRQGQPYFASVIESNAASILCNIEKSILEDRSKRGVVHLYQQFDLLKAALALSHARRVAITTGFPVHTQQDVKEETDGLPGALSICQALMALGKDVVLISDKENKRLFESCVEHVKRDGCLRQPVEVLTYSKAAIIWEEASADAPPWDCLVAIERAGRGKDDKYWSMRAKPVSVEPVDDLFLKALTNPLVSTVAIGDGGNELGMGKVHDQVVKHIWNGPTIACTTPADFVIACGVSNWGGYALSLALFVVSSSPVHQRYRNHGIDAAQPPPLGDCLPTLDQIGSLLKHMNGLGISDGVTGGKDQSVDGYPLKDHLDKVTELTNHLLAK